MYVCICHSITDKDIKKSVSQGAETIQDLQAMTGCATGCGGCLEYAEELLHKYQRKSVPEFLNLYPNSLVSA
jgi:bacterioferritin-associated ferredoxin